MIPDKIRDFLMPGEGQNIEFKKSCQSINAIDAIGQAVSGFLNTTGGYIVCGVDDDGKVVGVEDSGFRKENTEKVLLKEISPKALISVDIAEIEGKKVLLVEVPAGLDVPYSFRDVYYLRKNDTTVKADNETVRDMVLRKQVEPERWERRFSSADIHQDLDLKEIDNTFRDLSLSGKQADIGVSGKTDDLSGSEGTDGAVKESFGIYGYSRLNLVTGILKNLSLFSYGRLTNAGDVLFTKNPAVRYPQIRLRAACYFSDKSGDSYRDIESFEGPLVSVLEETFRFVMRNTATSAHFEDDSLKRNEINSYPPDAIREGLVNAFVHRDYSSFSGGIFVNIYPDRLEITNSGSFPEGVTPEKLSTGHISVLRNPDIAHVMYLRGFMERLGRGSVMIRESCTKSGLPLPEWSEDGHNVTLTFFATEVTPQVTPYVTPQVSPEVMKMINALNGEMSRNEIQEILGLKDAKYFRKAYILPALNEGLIEMTIPDKPKSRLQKYRITEKGREIKNSIKS